MNEPFIIPVIYQGTECEFKARFERWGSTHRIAVLINEMTVNFEPDGDGTYHSIINPEADRTNHTPDVNLVCAVAEKLASLTR